jgi:hypothetical protein
MIDDEDEDDYRKIFGGRTFKAWFWYYHTIYSNRESYYGADADDDDDDDNDDDPNYRHYLEYCHDPEFYHYMFDIRGQVLDEFRLRLQTLMFRQYPSFQKEVRPAVLDHFQKILNSQGQNMLIALYYVLDDQKKGVDFHEKYADFDQWVKLYGRPSESPQLAHAPLSLKPKAARQWEKERDEKQEETNLLHQWKANRISEFKETARSVLFEHYPEILDLDSQGWILYSYYVHEEYELYAAACEKIQMFIDFEYPEEYLNLPSDEYNKKVKESTLLFGKRIIDLRKRRVRGEQI